MTGSADISSMAVGTGQKRIMGEMEHNEQPDTKITLPKLKSLCSQYP